MPDSATLESQAATGTPQRSDGAVTDVTRDSALRGILEQARSEQGIDPAPAAEGKDAPAQAPSRTRDPATGKFAAAISATIPAEDAPATDAAAPQISPDQISEAMDVLRRDGWTYDDIAEMRKDPARLVRVSKPLAERQAGTSRKMQELTESRREKPAEPEAPKFDVGGKLATIKAELNPESGSALDEVIAHLTSRLDEIDQRAQGSHQAATSAQAQLTTARMDKERTALRERFPQLENDAQWSKVTEYVNDVLAPSGKYSGPTGFSEAFEEACFAKLGKEITAEWQQERARRTAMRQQGQPARADGAGRSPAAPLSPDQRRDTVLRSILEAERRGEAIPDVAELQGASRG